MALFRETADQEGIARCLGSLGNIAWAEKNFEKARQLYEQSLASLEPDTFAVAMVLNNLGSLARIRGDWPAARDYYLRSREICERLGAEAGVAFADMFLGKLATVRRELDEARAHFERHANDSWLQASPNYRAMLGIYLGYIYLLLGNKLEAQQILNQVLEAAAESIDQIPDIADGWLVIEGKARLELMAGRAERAAQLFGAAWTWREKNNDLLTEFERPDYEAALASARSAIGGIAFDEAFAKGQTMTIEHILAFASEETHD